MSSPSRNEQLEKLLAAQYELESCDPQFKKECLTYFESLIDEVIAEHNCSRTELIVALKSKMIEYRRAKLMAERRRQTL